MIAERAISVGNTLGEGPIWDHDHQTLYWVDILEKCFYHAKLDDKTPHKVAVGLQIGALALCQDDELLLATENGFALWQIALQQLTRLDHLVPDLPGDRFNDGALDRAGRFLAGTMSHQPENSLFSLGCDGQVSTLEGGLTISNGIGWNPDNTLMYLADSGPRTIYVYDYDIETGSVANRRVFMQFDEASGTPDGLTVDQHGDLWVAMWDGWCVQRISPDATIKERIQVPAQRPTSCTFGGADLKTLFVTSARAGLSDAELADQPRAGDIFSLEVDDSNGVVEPRACVSSATFRTGS